MFFICSAVFWSSQGLSVHFKTQQPVYIIKGHSLNLNAQIDLLDGERLTKVTWDHAAKYSGKNQTVAEFPHRPSNGKVTLEEQGATLKITDYQPADSGVYTITVINQSGQARSAQRTVREYRKMNEIFHFWHQHETPACKMNELSKHFKSASCVCSGSESRIRDGERVTRRPTLYGGLGVRAHLYLAP